MVVTPKQSWFDLRDLIGAAGASGSTESSTPAVVAAPMEKGAASAAGVTCKLSHRPSGVAVAMVFGTEETAVGEESEGARDVEGVLSGNDGEEAGARVRTFLRARALRWLSLSRTGRLGGMVGGRGREVVFLKRKEKKDFEESGGLRTGKRV